MMQKGCRYIGKNDADLRTQPLDGAESEQAVTCADIE
jgi:hypothetical protein